MAKAGIDDISRGADYQTGLDEVAAVRQHFFASLAMGFWYNHKEGDSKHEDSAEIMHFFGFLMVDASYCILTEYSVVIGSGVWVDATSDVSIRSIKKGGKVPPFLYR